MTNHTKHNLHLYITYMDWCISVMGVFIGTDYELPPPLDKCSLVGKYEIVHCKPQTTENHLNVLAKAQWHSWVATSQYFRFVETRMISKNWPNCFCQRVLIGVVVTCTVSRILRTSLKYRLRCCSMDERVEQIIVRKQGHETSVVERCLSRDEVECRWSLGFRGRLKADRDGGRMLIGFAAEKQWDDERRLFIKVVFGSKPNKCQMERQKD